MRAQERSAGALFVVAASYVATGWLGIGLAGAPGNVTAVWLPSGLALSATLILGARAWPGILAGASLLNAIFYVGETTPMLGAVAASLAIGAGSTVQSLVGRGLVMRFAGGLDALDAPRRAFALIGCAALACTVAASTGTLTVLASGQVTTGELGRTWLTWWLGDFVGVMLVVPIALAWRARLAFEVRPAERVVHAIALLAAIEVLFAPIGLGPGIDVPYALLPFFVTIAYRLGPRDVSLAAACAWLGVVIAIARGAQPLGPLPLDRALLAADALLLVLAIPALVLASAETGRRRSERALEDMRDALEARVAARTHELERANADLAAEVAERRSAQAKLVESEARLETAIESLPFDFWILDRDERYVMLNSTAKAHWGDRTGKRVEELDLPAHVLAHWRDNNARAFAGEIIVRPVQYEHGGVTRSYEGVLAPIVVDGRVAGVLGVNVDVTERVRLAEQIVRAQKVETVGRLAGGIAHDFNNLLTIVGGASEVLARRAASGSIEAELSGSILEATRQAAELTRRLLLFAGRQPADERVAPLDELVDAPLALLRPLFPENVSVRIERAAARSVRIDPTRLGQVLVNLALNARDAMPSGGTFSVRTFDATLDGESPGAWVEAPPAPGTYAVIEIRDSGHGMTDEVRRLAFEPFFTTKGASRGSGLGLASVHGIVRQAGGAIALESAPRAGTTFRIALPAATATAPRASSRSAPPPAASARGGRATILLVEDDPAVRRTIERMLEDAGHHVLVAPDVEAGRAIAARERFDLLVSDVVMPGQSGPTLARELRATRPDLPVLFVSAYAEKDTEGVDAPLLAKPFTAEALQRAVAGLLTR